MTRTAFLAALRSAIVATYGDASKPFGFTNWAVNSDKLDNFMAITRRTIEGKRNEVSIDGPVFAAAWRTIGGKGKPTYKGLRALPAA